MISPGSTNPKVTDQGSPNTFRVIGRDDQQGTVAADYLADNYSNDRIAIFNDGSVYGAGLAGETKKHFNERGLREVLFGSYSPGQSSYSTLVQQLRSEGVRVLFVGGYSSDIAIIARQAKKQIPNLQIVSGDTLATTDFLLTAGEAADGSVFTFGPDIRRRPEAASVVASFTKDGYDPGGKTLYSYAAVQVWSDAVQRAESTKMPDVIAALRGGTFETVLGRIGFDSKGDVTGIVPFVLYRMGKDNFAPIE
jgi:branched-chain amino acid transport system substrate-binding protein